MSREDIIQQLEFLRDIGVTTLNLRETKEPTAPMAKPSPVPSAADTLSLIREDIGDCQRCKLAPTRTNIVFGSGNINAELVFVGEAPGSDEDEQGLPFVGRAGQLLTKIIDTSVDPGRITRADVYICNILKCRPPNNRNPEPDEVASCNPFLKRQLATIRPKVVCCLGTFAAQNLLQSQLTISKLRGRFFDIDGMRVIATFHPAYLLRSPEKKREVWEDMKLIGAELIVCALSFMFVEIAVCLPLSRTFLYELEAPIAIGCRVLVQFRNRDIDGFVVGLHRKAPEGLKILPVKEVLDRDSLLAPDVLELCKWIAEYYMAPIGEVLKSALPPGITQKHVDRFDGGHLAIVRTASPFSLTTEQLTALYAIQEKEGFHTVLLHGVTGSGKTEVYIQAAENTVERGKTCLVLVPEIGLTPQLVERFAERFPGRTAVLHSGLTKKQRIDEWLRIRGGFAPIVVGTRSAVFAPSRNLGLIIVDEEHETSYKQEETPRYNARDTAVMRGKKAGATVVLGSATPSMESFQNGQSKKFSYVHMTSRVEQRPLPEVEIVNMREEYAAEGKQTVFSRRLLQGIATRLERGEQSMVLLNRRGFAAFLLCRHCGFNFQCVSCSVAMTYHKRIHRLLCHYCGNSRRPPEKCTECGSEYVHFVGEGTERIESDLRELFPEARIGRIDRDTMRHVRDFDRVLGGFRRGEIDILVGTQMIAKGHDFPQVTLVGVLAADAALSMPDFRAAERTFQLLTQVAGRSGRGERPGEVIIQSFFPDHYTFQLACTQRFEDFYARESRYRQAMFYPPFTALAGILITNRDKEAAAIAARGVGEFLNSVRPDTVRILGPAPAPLERVKQVHRYQLLIKASSRTPLHRVLERLLAHLDTQKLGGTRVLIDVDPVSLL